VHSVRNGFTGNCSRNVVFVTDGLVAASEVSEAVVVVDELQVRISLLRFPFFFFAVSLFFVGFFCVYCFRGVQLVAPFVWRGGVG